MRIDRLRVKNFKGSEERTFDFSRSLDAPCGGNGSFHRVIGQNGKGETSVLGTLVVAAGSSVYAADAVELFKTGMCATK